MNVGQLIQTLVATVVGGLIVIATNWISTTVKRREAVQEWYEKTYVTEGIDSIVIYLYSLDLYFFNKSSGGFVQIIDVDAIPTEAIVELQILFGTAVIPRIIALTHELMPSQDKRLVGSPFSFLIRGGTLRTN